MTLNSATKFPSRRVYVLKVSIDAEPNAIAGRLENLVTGQRLDFASGRELLASLASDLAATVTDPKP